MKISTYTENYERDLHHKRYSGATIKNYVCQVKMFLNHFKDKEPASIL